MKSGLHQLWTVLWALVISLLTLMPVEKAPETPFLDIPHLDKLVHFGIFGLLSWLMIRGLLKFNEVKDKITPIVISLVFPTIYGGIIEILQHFIPGRGPDILDFLANTLGILMGVVTFLMFSDYRGRKH